MAIENALPFPPFQEKSLSRTSITSAGVGGATNPSAGRGSVVATFFQSPTPPSLSPSGGGGEEDQRQQPDIRSTALRQKNRLHNGLPRLFCTRASPVDKSLDGEEADTGCEGDGGARGVAAFRDAERVFSLEEREGDCGVEEIALFISCIGI